MNKYKRKCQSWSPIIGLADMRAFSFARKGVHDRCFLMYVKFCRISFISRYQTAGRLLLTSSNILDVYQQ